MLEEESLLLSNENQESSASPTNRKQNKKFRITNNIGASGEFPTTEKMQITDNGPDSGTYMKSYDQSNLKGDFSGDGQDPSSTRKGPKREKIPLNIRRSTQTEPENDDVGVMGATQQIHQRGEQNNNDIIHSFNNNSSASKTNQHDFNADGHLLGLPSGKNKKT